MLISRPSVISDVLSWLSLCEYWYNTNWHSAVGKSPFEVLYGQPPRYFGISPSDTIPPLDIQQWLQDRQVVVESVRQHLLRAQQRMKQLADKHRTERTFDVGELVFLKLQPYVQSSVVHRANHKLAYKYYGPYKIVGRIGEVAYKLELPEGSRIHPVFHISQLKKVVAPTCPISSTLNSVTSHLQIPISVLERRVRQKGKRTVALVLSL